MLRSLLDAKEERERERERERQRETERDRERWALLESASVAR